jgi:hypothetical protein
LAHTIFSGTRVKITVAARILGMTRQPLNDLENDRPTAN